MEVKSSANIQMNFLKIFEVQRLFLSDAIIFALVQYAIPYINGKGSISWSLLGILFLVSLTTLLFSQGEIERFSKAFYFCSIPIIIICTWLGDIPIFEMFLLFIFSLWRLKVLFIEDGDEDSENILSSRLLATILIFIFLYFVGFISGMKSRNLLIIFPVLQIFLYSYGTFFKRYIQSSSISKKTIAAFSSFLIITPIVISTAVTLIASVIKNGLSVIFDKIFWFIVTLLSPLISFLSNFMEKKNEEYNNRMMESAKEQMKLRIQKGNYLDNFRRLQKNDNEKIYIIIGIVIVVIIIISLILHFKKRKSKTANVGNEMKQSIFHKLIDNQNKKDNHANYYSKSNQKIRKFVRQLEHFSAKHKSKRRGAESVRDWLNRLNIQVSEKWVFIYESVRYGSIQVTEEDIEQFALEMEKIKNRMKEFQKK
ncbi:hypothetical protein AN964_15820 [Heyndrickxia shackletonii]|uniref:DUF4129 domain-containing protein n=1 Tax=Heyndrickxia shackletonii TaxID=157838 RepID=A0A0Q3WZM3_9BACI|nr:hypothetical protein [Heyndrickxia shackletonii]KQL54829.1 hypothetical protein AN964_15820 [Heyndrickxia shackletonii]NEY99521.1 hypothetical protein [Heyndrickxia shackletonii]